jgi:hypothetical protein
MSAPQEFIDELIEFMQDQGYCGDPHKLDDISHSMLEEAWTYWRPVGLMRVSSSSHCFIARLITNLKNYDEYRESWKKLKTKRSFIRYYAGKMYDDGSDVVGFNEEFLKLPGTAFLSNVSFRNVAICGQRKNLTRKEHEILSLESRIVTYDEYVSKSFLCGK